LKHQERRVPIAHDLLDFFRDWLQGLYVLSAAEHAVKAIQIAS
jgi:hypothetical protein